ncbi:MAG: 50S ribosomal protein L18 [Firmicutes bacterium]|nr:50S ribosomal protein L18 [Bacillota bacterium]
MIIKPDRNKARKKRHLRVRGKLSGTASVPRLNVYKSVSHIYAQVIDDTAGRTLASSSTIGKGVNVKALNKTQAATVIGKDIAKKAKTLGIKAVVFDRGGYLYTGRVKALADGAREGGLEF